MAWRGNAICRGWPAMYPRTATPVLATALIVAATMLLALLVPFERLAESTSQARHVRVPLWVPVAGLATCLAMIAAALLG
jgi:APA family basic amino acid/polyamine antiporter